MYMQNMQLCVREISFESGNCHGISPCSNSQLRNVVHNAILPEVEMKNSSFFLYHLPGTLLTGAINAEIERLLNESNIRNPGYFLCYFLSINVQFILMLLSFNKCSISELTAPIYQSVEETL